VNLQRILKKRSLRRWREWEWCSWWPQRSIGRGAHSGLRRLWAYEQCGQA